MIIGYARVSTEDQNLDLQTDALISAGCQEIYKEKISGSLKDRPELDRLRKEVTSGDMVVVWKFDRLGRSVQNLVELTTEFKEKGVGFKSLTENVDTTTTMGQFMFHLFAAFAELERATIRERVNAGLIAARKRGIKGGRKNKLSDKQADQIKRLSATDDYTVTEICQIMGISRPTFYRYWRS